MAKETIDFGATVGFLEEHSSTEGSVTKVTKSDYQKYMEEGGVSKQVLNTVHERNENLYGGMALLGAAKLAKRIEDAKEAGDDPNELTHQVDVAIHGGTARLTSRAAKVSPNPRHASHGGPTHITTYGGSRLELRVKSSLPGQAQTEASAMIKTALGIKD